MPSIFGYWVERPSLNIHYWRGLIFLSTPYLTIDGIYGPAILNALKSYLPKRGKEGEKVLVRVFNIMQGQRYIEICERNPSQEQFFYGWIAKRVSL